MRVGAASSLRSSRLSTIRTHRLSRREDDLSFRRRQLCSQAESTIFLSPKTECQSIQQKAARGEGISDWTGLRLEVFHSSGKRGLWARRNANLRMGIANMRGPKQSY